MSIKFLLPGGGGVFWVLGGGGGGEVADFIFMGAGDFSETERDRLESWAKRSTSSAN